MLIQGSLVLLLTATTEVQPQFIFLETKVMKFHVDVTSVMQNALLPLQHWVIAISVTKSRGGSIPQVTSNTEDGQQRPALM